MYKETHRLEFYKLDKEDNDIGLLMMVKNEEKRIHVSLQSVLGVAKALIIYDTGSTDNTINIIVDFAKANKINLYLIEGVFEDFSTSRNISLDYADTVDVKYLLLLDCNDELKGAQHLQKLSTDFSKKTQSAFLLCQQWKSIDNHMERLDKFYNIRFIKNRFDWRYKGSVHEWLTRVNSINRDVLISKPEDVCRLDNDDIILFQDRTKDDDKSLRRFTRDRECLLKEFKEDPRNPRTVFYLAQTCQCLNLHEESLYYNKLRTKLEGFTEEIYHACYRYALSAQALNHSWDDVMPWYMKALQHCQRAEPLVKIAEYYRGLADFQKNNKDSNHVNAWKLAYMFVNQACELEYPHHLVLFVDRAVYDYGRFHLLGIIGFYAGQFERGKYGCIKALEKTNHELDRKNLEIYLNIEKQQEVHKKEKEAKIQEELNKQKKSFIDTYINEIKKKYNRTNNKTLLLMAEKKWEENIVNKITKS